MSPRRLVALTALTMAAFAANSVLCRLALRTTEIDPATFTGVRLAAGAAALWAIASVRRKASEPGNDGHAGSWRSALALFAYAAAFSFAYVSLTTATGALLLFGAVQLTMLGYGLARGERLSAAGTAGAAIAVAGLLVLLAPGLAAPPLAGAALMAGAGVAWGIYSIRGRESRDPIADTAGNFLRSVPAAAALALLFAADSRVGVAGLVYAAVSGAIASGAGYAIWYTVLPRMPAMSAAIVQLSVPVLAAAGGAIVLSEPVTLRLVVATATTLGGIALVLRARSAGGNRSVNRPVLSEIRPSERTTRD